MRIFILLLFVLLLGIGVGVGVKMFSFSGGGKNASDTGEREVVYWVAPMDKNFRRDEAGKSPMGMDLVPIYADEISGGASVPEGAIRVDPVYTHSLGVKTAGVQIVNFGQSIRAFGLVVPSTRLEQAVDVRTKGWIVELATDAVGDPVQKGDLLFTYYSPDLMTAQGDFLIGSRSAKTEQRLRFRGMDQQSIAALKKKGRFMEETPFYAPIDGTVTMLNVRKGSHVNEGANVITLQDFSKIWVNADVPVRDVQFLRVGTSVRITVPETGAVYDSVIDFIHPVADTQSRTVRVRMILENADGALKPDMYVDTVFQAAIQSRLAVPSEALLYSAAGAYVVVDVGDGYFRPVMVKTGVSAGGLSEIKSGLKVGQRIVTSGQFMLDAESNLKGGMDSMVQDGMQGGMQQDETHEGESHHGE